MAGKGPSWRTRADRRAKGWLRRVEAENARFDRDRKTFDERYGLPDLAAPLEPLSSHQVFGGTSDADQAALRDMPG